MISNELKPDDCEYLCDAQVILQTLREFLVLNTAWTQLVIGHCHLEGGFQA
jgi:hypothetical protein